MGLEAVAEGFCGNDEIGLDAVTLAGEHGTRASEAGLDFVGDEQDAVLVAEIDQDLEVIWRWRDEAAFAEYWFGNHGGNFFVGDDALEGVFEMACAVKIARGIFQVIRAAIAVSERDAIDFARKRSESGLIGMSLVG